VSASVDRDQLAALQALRRGFGVDQVEVLAVVDTDALTVLGPRTQPAAEPPTKPAPATGQGTLAVDGHLPATPITKPCRCHADDSLYGSLLRCPSCGHRSYDRIAESCERRRCGYEGPQDGSAAPGAAARAAGPPPATSAS
jgi:hypothetical protein